MVSDRVHSLILSSVSRWASGLRDCTTWTSTTATIKNPGCWVLILSTWVHQSSSDSVTITWRVSHCVCVLGGNHGEESERFSVSVWDPSAAPLHLNGGGLLQRCCYMDIHTAQAQVHTHTHLSLCVKEVMCLMVMCVYCSGTVCLRFTGWWRRWRTLKPSRCSFTVWV